MNDKYEPFPTLLNKSDALLHAAGYLDRQVGNLKLISIMREAFAKSENKVDDPKFRDDMKELATMASGIVDADLQARAMQDAAKEIRALANEIKLVEARAASGDIMRELAR